MPGYSDGSRITALCASALLSGDHAEDAIRYISSDTLLISSVSRPDACEILSCGQENIDVALNISHPPASWVYGLKMFRDIDVGESAESLLVDLGQHYRPALMAFFARRLENPGEAEDMAHEILLKLTELPANEIRNPEAYIFRMASNLVRDRYRQGKVRDAYRSEQVEVECRAADYIDPLRLLEGKERLGLVSTALSSLPQRTRDILLLFRIERIRKRDIAESFGISVSAVDKHLIRATMHLAKSLEDEA